MKKQNFEQVVSELKNEIKELKANERSKEIRLKRFLKASLITFLFTSSFYGFALILNLHIFADGDIISAQKINENFAYLENKIDSSAGGSFISENIPSHAVINLQASDNGKLFVIQKTAEFNLPAIGSVTPGYTISVSLVGLSQARVNLAGSDEFESSTNMILYTSSSYNAGYYELMSTGTGWINKISSGGSYYRIDPARIYTAVACNGKGTGDSNCFQNTTATDINHRYVVIDNYYYNYYDYDMRWERMGLNDYLLNDPQNRLPTQTLTKKYELSSSEIQFNGSITYAISRNTTDIRAMFNYQAGSPENHGGGSIVQTAVDDYALANLFDSNQNMYMGTNCRAQFGNNWRNITEAEAQSEGIVFTDEYWTGSSGVTMDTYIYIDSAGNPLEGINSGQYRKYVCVLN